MRNDSEFQLVNSNKRSKKRDARKPGYQSNPTIPSYHLPLHQVNRHYDRDSHDYWNGDKHSHNRFDPLRKLPESDGEMYSDPPHTSDDEYRQHVNRVNSQYI